jgi:competence protein ComEA
MAKVIIAAIIITIIGLFVLTKIDPANQTQETIVTVVSDDGSGNGSVKVTIEGEVLHPGEYSITADKTLSDLIALAGGVTDDADPESYTPGLLIGNRTSFYISPSSTAPAACSATLLVKVNINTADAASLKTVGFSSSQAEALISYRNANGSFTAIEDIMKVSGIGQKTYLAVRDKICLSS